VHGSSNERHLCSFLVPVLPLRQLSAWLALHSCSGMRPTRAMDDRGQRNPRRYVIEDGMSSVLPPPDARRVRRGRRRPDAHGADRNPDGRQTAMTSDCIVKGPDGQLYRMSADAFAALFKGVDDA
jgi:hypothetical protein